MSKQIEDAEHRQGCALRYGCIQCGHIFQVDPQRREPQANLKVNELNSRDDMPARVKLWKSGDRAEPSWDGQRQNKCLSGCPGVGSESTWDKAGELRDGYRTKSVGANVTSMHCNELWVTLGIAVDAINGMGLSINELPGEDAEQLEALLEPVLNAVDADVVISNDADAFKKVNGETSRAQ